MEPSIDLIENEAFSADVTSVFEYDEMAESLATASTEMTYVEDAENLYAPMF